MLLRLSEVCSGTLLVDGRDVREAPLRRLRRSIGLVPQTPFLFEVRPLDGVVPTRPWSA